MRMTDTRLRVCGSGITSWSKNEYSAVCTCKQQCMHFSQCGLETLSLHVDRQVAEQDVAQCNQRHPCLIIIARIALAEPMIQPALPQIEMLQSRQECSVPSNQQLSSQLGRQ